jgi:hypothetical protein
MPFSDITAGHIIINSNKKWQKMAKNITGSNNHHWQ